ncbi:cobalt ABC transporter ATP-binding protein [Acinetobacter sp. ANC 4558]|uniref:energy-coupling factor ABC transporter ATP-binding protein n=1 Tax=Acinetobacter sp. ANC 4558 TaxID=1977876 RepID=UPI000A34798B|nr:ABC transporter ATP-binding protein [Acinetobacter sp. ANC 4558]OTG86159.1 cobalt ABC transporter ATP-binding protein [Acinetobacter sp. ANC 4558]
MISVQNISHSFGSWVALRNISLELTEKRIAIIGANGGGKSTLARMLNGLLVPDQGHVLVNGINTKLKPIEARRHVGFIFSDADSQIIMPTVQEDVALGLRWKKLKKEVVHAEVLQILKRFNLHKHADHPAHSLSGGQKQMLALASVLVTDPKILICDEPTTLLDFHNVNVFVKTIRNLEQQVILLTHQLEIIEDFDRVLVVDQGQIYFDGAPAEAVKQYKTLVESRLADFEQESAA